MSSLRLCDPLRLCVKLLIKSEGRMGQIVIDPGLSTTVQDGGRTGYREWGVPPGGAFDRGAAGLANALVGNATPIAPSWS